MAGDPLPLGVEGGEGQGETCERGGIKGVCPLIATAEPVYSRLQGNKEYCLLKEKSTITEIEK